MSKSPFWWAVSDPLVPTKLTVLPGWAKVAALYKTTSFFQSPCLPWLRNGALPRLSAPDCLLFHRHLQVPGAVGGHTILSFPARRCGQRVHAGSTEKRAEALGGRRATAAWRRAITFPGGRLPARKICVNVMNFAGTPRKGESTNATLALKITALPGLLVGAWLLRAWERAGRWQGAGWLCPRSPAGVALALHEALPCPTASGQLHAVRRKVQSPPGEENPAFQLAVQVLRNYLPRTKNSSHLTAHQTWLFIGVVCMTEGPGAPSWTKTPLC